MTRIVVETKRLSLREMTPNDLDFVAEMLGDAEVMRFYPKRLSRKEARQWIDKTLQRYAEDSYGLWLAADRSSGCPVGQIGLLRQVVEGTARDEIGYLVHRPFWRRGYAAEGAAAVRDYAFGQLDKRRVISLIRQVNIPSQRVALRLGMKPERIVSFKGFDHLVFSLERDSNEDEDV